MTIIYQMVNRSMIKNIYRRDQIFLIESLVTVAYSTFLRYSLYRIDDAGKMVRDTNRLRSIDDRTKRASCKNVSESQNRGFV